MFGADSLAALCHKTLNQATTNRWFTAVQNIIHHGIKQKHVPSPTIQLHLQSFFDNAAMLMTLQLQSLCKVFMEKYTEFLCRSKENHMFIIKLVAVGQQIKLEPTYHNFETVLLDILDSLLHSVRIIPRVENHLNTVCFGSQVLSRHRY
ncbi:dynein axonemal heavy chain 7-like isoform X2 [Tachypleus tridentatus]